MVMIGEAAQAFDALGNPRDEKTKDLMRQLLESLVAWTIRLREPGTTGR